MFTKLKCSYRWLLRKRVRDSGLLFTRNNIRIDRDIDYDGDKICAYIEVWFDPDKKFGLKLGDDEYVNVYAYITPYTGEVRVTYVIYYGDYFIDDERIFTKLTPGEKNLIREMVNETSLTETGMMINDNYREFEKNERNCDTAFRETVL